MSATVLQLCSPYISASCCSRSTSPEAASAAQQDAENLVIDVGGAEADRLRAARARDAELARREAELMSGQAPSQPPAKPAPRKPAKKK